VFFHKKVFIGGGNFIVPPLTILSFKIKIISGFYRKIEKMKFFSKKIMVSDSTR